MNFGLAGAASLSLPNLLRMKAQAATTPSAEKTSVIMVWLPGGMSQIDTFDPKPESGSEYRGPFKSISTAIPGVNFTELVPRHAAMADKFTLVRSMRQTAPGHPAGSMQLLSGDPDTRDKVKSRYPDWMSIASYLRAKEGQSGRSLPNYICASNNILYTGPQYLGNAYLPFTVNGNLNDPNYRVPNVGLSDVTEAARLGDRVTLRKHLDTLERRFDKERELQALDEFEAQAMSMLVSPDAREAFDLSKEDDATRDRYGRHQWGQQLLLARRLVEAGVDIVTSELSGPQCGRVQNWDDHAVNQHIFDALRFRMDAYDQACTALIEDLYTRGLDQKVLVCITGEFGRTPKVYYDRSTGAGEGSGPTGTMQPGREHWPNAFSNIWAGGGMRQGQVVGATDKHSAEVVERACGPGDFLATFYKHLGIDYHHIMIPDFNGRPTPIVDQGNAIPELGPQVTA